MEKILKELNVKITIKGYYYWITAMEYMIKVEDITNAQVVKEVYGYVAKTHNTTRSKAERALRHSIEDKQELIKQYFNVTYKVVNKDFLYLCLDKIKELSTDSKSDK